ncbi:hypothetical protein PZA11_004020 [Diplocarpon coronariae]
MPVQCLPCNRTFEELKHFEQHLRSSRAHVKPPGRIQVRSVPLNQSRSPVKSYGQTNRNATNWPPLQDAALPHRTAAGSLREQPSRTLTSSRSSPEQATPVIKRISSQPAQWTASLKSESKSVLDTLATHLNSQKELEANRILVRPYNPEDWAQAPRKCTRCQDEGAEAVVRDESCIFHSSKRNKYNIKKPYRCCATTESREGCLLASKHDFQLPSRFAKYGDFRESPLSGGLPKARAVVLDCEMAGVVGNATGDPILLCAIDYVTGAEILNRYIVPTQRITQMRSDLHGVTRATLDEAESRGIALSGWEGARAELWNHIDEDTILIGHALENDLNALRMIHRRIVDSGILVRSAIGSGVQFSLQALCSQLPRVEIRKNRGGVHDCLEDVLATREVVLFCTRRTDEFNAWVKVKKVEQAKLERERAILKAAKALAKESDRARLEATAG